MTALTVSFDTTLCRRVLQVTSLAGTTDHVEVQRAVSPYVQWEDVRGWSTQAIASSAVTYYDYEFPEGVAYKYRVLEYNASGTHTATTEFSVSAVTFDDVWLKVPAAPFLNRTVIVADKSTITNKSRSALMDVVGRTNPVQIGGVRSSLSYTLQLLTLTAAEERDMEYTLSTGDVIFIHLPSNVDLIPGGYFSVGDVTREPTMRTSSRRVWSLPLATVAAPGSDVIGSAYTIQSVLAEYATITDMMADNATIADLLARTGTPSEVIVP
ncbi:hypothetical protein [Kribbella jiaozuonensis]|uniref:Uncharacterized protein n=1 Tax=Kribbella jiaozuonensis TaxID=2575441 RepID=A0A4U3M3C7_9ACTN|nr:hypothetical protein [Kribbella jiaozuonensis]TKK79195.1 hypothetical protein FDA38_12255 [Kribbella jiaozuonensis]TKK83265.1 hypothetical protein FDA38_11210 [Kribbella jiaozuonensis]